MKLLCQRSGVNCRPAFIASMTLNVCSGPSDGEKFVSEQAANGDNESHPERPIPFPLYADLAADIRKIHR